MTETINDTIRRRAGKLPAPPPVERAPAEAADPAAVFEGLLALREDNPEEWGRLDPAARIAVETYAAIRAAFEQEEDHG